MLRTRLSNRLRAILAVGACSLAVTSLVTADDRQGDPRLGRFEPSLNAPTDRRDQRGFQLSDSDTSFDNFSRGNDRQAARTGSTTDRSPVDRDLTVRDEPSTTQKLLERIEQLEKRIENLERRPAVSTFTPLPPATQYQSPTPTLPPSGTAPRPNDSYRPQTPSPYQTTPPYQQAPPTRPPSLNPPTGQPPQSWQRFNFNGQWFYIVPTDAIQRGDQFRPAEPR